MCCAVWYHLYNYKNVKNPHGGALKVTLLYGCFSRFLNCTNGTKSRRTSHISAGKKIKRLFITKIVRPTRGFMKPIVLVTLIKFTPFN